MTTIMQSNTRQRKSLAEQIDRLDRILDGLAEGLNEAVAAAVQQAVALAVRQAVQTVLTEVLSNPLVLDTIPSNAAPSTAAAPEPTGPETAVARRVGRLRRAWQWVRAQIRRAAGGLSIVGKHLRSVRQFKVEFVTALGAGVAAGLAAYYAGPWLSIAVSGLGAFVGTLAVHAGLWLRRTVGALAASST
jgi:hypothetical protein